MNIIALKGKGQTGKTTTIGFLHFLLIKNGYQILESSFNKAGKDFRTIFSKKGKLIGITSSGDTFDLVHDNLDHLIKSGCIICLCACRTFDRGSHGTNAAIDTFLPTYKKQYIDKTIALTPAQEPSVNQSNAQTLFNTIDALV